MNTLEISLLISIFSVISTPIAAKYQLASRWLTALTASSAIFWIIAILFQLPFDKVTFQWIQTPDFNLSISFSADYISQLFVAIILIISLAVQLISLDYMAHEKQQAKIWSFLALFIFSMHLIALGDNILTVFIGWELVGFCSWGLIGFWQEKPIAGPAAQKAFILNRIGDMGLIIGMTFVFAIQGDTSFQSLFALKNHEYQVWVSMFLIMGALGKSAQFPLQVWLPDAMAGPTTASALIHAATMVAAGVYWIIRIFPFLHPLALDVLIISGSLTAILSAFSACVQTDIKKVLAYSTLSQLGIMTVAVGAGAPEAAFFHLATHAFFKAGLFLATAAFLHAMHQESHDDQWIQNLQNLAGIGRKSGITGITFVIFLTALTGLPLSSGFLSKDLILLALENSNGLAYTAWFVILLTSVLTVAYSFRLFTYLFLIPSEKNYYIPKIYPIVLSFLALASGFWFFSWFPWDVQPTWLADITLSIQGYSPIKHHSHLSPIISLIGILLGYLLYRFRQLFSLQSIRYVIEQHFYFDYLQTSIGSWVRNSAAKILHKTDILVIDGFIHTLVKVFTTGKMWNMNVSISGWAAVMDSYGIDFLVSNTALFFQNLSKKARNIQTANIQTNIMFALLITFVVMLLVLLFV